MFNSMQIIKLIHTKLLRYCPWILQFDWSKKNLIFLSEKYFSHRVTSQTKSLYYKYLAFYFRSFSAKPDGFFFFIFTSKILIFGPGQFLPGKRSLFLKTGLPYLRSYNSMQINLKSVFWMNVQKKTDGRT